MKRIALYAGSFDPITNGHLDVIKATSYLVDKLVIAVGTHHTKQPFFTFDERTLLIKAALSEQSFTLPEQVDVIAFDNLLVETALSIGASLLIRGIRDGTDFDYEMQIAAINKTMAPKIQTIFVPANGATRTISATLIRQIASFGGDIRPFVPTAVAEALLKKTANLT